MNCFRWLIAIACICVCSQYSSAQIIAMDSDVNHNLSLYIDGVFHSSYVCKNDTISIKEDLPIAILSPGIHTIEALLSINNGEYYKASRCYFLKTLQQDKFDNVHYQLFLDGFPNETLFPGKAGELSMLDLNVENLSTGLHSLVVSCLDNDGNIVNTSSGWFIKTPYGGEGVCNYNYWINDNTEDLKNNTLVTINPDFSLIDLLDIPSYPIRSLCYDFSIEDDTPFITAKNRFNICFNDLDNRQALNTYEYLDSRTKSIIENITTLNESGQIGIGSLGENEIKWFTFEGEIGDSIAISLNNPAMMELFSPSAKKITARNRADVLSVWTSSLTENGKYYIAIHDVSSDSGNTLSLDFNLIPKFTLLRSSPTHIGNDHIVVLDLFGNGFNSINSLELQNESFSTSIDNITAIDNFNLSAFIDLDSIAIPNGRYDLVASFIDTNDNSRCSVSLPDAVHFEPVKNGDISVSIETKRIVATPLPIYIKITNESNCGQWCVPLNLGFERTGGETTTHFLDFRFAVDSICSDIKAPIYLTENLLNTGKKGVFIPSFIPYIGPNETITLTIGFEAPAHQKLNTYVWCGKPWSVEADEMLLSDYDTTEILTPSGTNILTLRDVANMIYTACNTPIQSRATTQPVPNVQITPRQAANAATRVGKTAIAGSGANGNWLCGGRAERNKLIMQNAGYTEGYTDGVVSYINGMIDTDTKMLAVGDALMAVGQTDDNLLGNAQALGNLMDARNAWENAVTPNPSADPYEAEVFLPFDPNDIRGYISPSGDTHIGLDVASIPYTIEFENDPNLASAPATVIRIEHTVPIGLIKPSSMNPESIKFGKKEWSLPKASHFIKTLDFRPEIDAIGELEFDFDSNTGKTSWLIRSLDPMTMNPVEFIDQGILPVNDDSGIGSGSVSFTVDLSENIPDNTSIDSKAEIYFDANSGISTPLWRNTTDFSRPTAEISEMTTTDNKSFSFIIDSFDAGSGIWYYDLYMRRSTETAWTLVMHNIQDDSFTFCDSDPTGIQPDFLIIATDKAGNRQLDSILSSIPGDADENGIVDATDIVVIRNFYIGKSSKINILNADLNRDDIIDVQDAASTRIIYLNSSTQN